MAERQATLYQRLIGGLLGEDLSKLDEEERRRVAGQATSRAVQGLLMGEGLLGGLGGYRRERQADVLRQQQQAARNAQESQANQIRRQAGLMTQAVLEGRRPLTAAETMPDASGLQLQRGPLDLARLARSPEAQQALFANEQLREAVLATAPQPPAAPRPLEFMKGPNDAIFALNDMTGEVREVVKAPPPVVAPPGGETTYDGLRKEWTKITEDYREIGTMWAKIKDAGSNPTAANDLALIFGYMKILDPGSVVREGEFANAQNAGGVDVKIRALYNNLKRGERLTEEQRQDFLRSAYGAVKSQLPILNNLENQFTSIALAGNLDPRRVIINPLEGALLPKITDDAKGQAALNNLPIGALFEGPDGSIRRKKEKTP